MSRVRKETLSIEQWGLLYARWSYWNEICDRRTELGKNCNFFSYKLFTQKVTGWNISIRDFFFFFAFNSQSTLRCLGSDSNLHNYCNKILKVMVFLFFFLCLFVLLLLLLLLLLCYWLELTTSMDTFLLILFIQEYLIPQRSQSCKVFFTLFRGFIIFILSNPSPVTPLFSKTQIAELLLSFSTTKWKKKTRYNFGFRDRFCGTSRQLEKPDTL